MIGYPKNALITIFREARLEEKNNVIILASINRFSFHQNFDYSTMKSSYSHSPRIIWIDCYSMILYFSSLLKKSHGYISN